MASTSSNKDLIDFSQPWDLSDAVLVVEDSRFHVHRCMLAIWSPVFLRMFTSEFKESATNEIPLLGKKADEVKELLLVIYPTSSKSIDENNYAFLLDLAREYIMAKLTERCENYLLSKVNGKVYHDFYSFSSNLLCLDLLGIAQEYEMETLEWACIEAAQDLSLTKLKSHKMYDEMNFSTYRKIAEGKMEKMEKRIQKR